MYVYVYVCVCLYACIFPSIDKCSPLQSMNDLKITKSLAYFRFFALCEQQWLSTAGHASWPFLRAVCAPNQAWPPHHLVVLVSKWYMHACRMHARMSIPICICMCSTVSIGICLWLFVQTDIYIIICKIYSCMIHLPPSAGYNTAHVYIYVICCLLGIYSIKITQ